MGKTTKFLSSSVGRKMTVALSGLFLCSFLVVHLAINLFVFKGDDGGTTNTYEYFNTYSEFMASNTFIRPLEWVLFGGFLLHAVLAIFLWFKNRMARPERYEENRPSENSTWSSRFMWLTGIFVGVFLVIHIRTFFIQSRFIEHKDMIEFVKDAFSSAPYVVFYLIALVFLGYHLKHGWQSAFQTMGLRVGRHEKLINAIGIIFWLIIPIGFATIPLYFLFAK